MVCTPRTKGLKKYAQYDDRWFLNLISNESNPKEVQTIAKMILNRTPFLQTYSPLTYRKQSSHARTKPEETTGELDLLQTQILNILPDLGIEKHEFLTDHLSRAPCSLMPNYNISDEIAEDGDSIQIYYKNRKLVGPIEKRSYVVYTLAVNQPFMIRGFVIPEKYEIVKNFLDQNYDYPLPQRS